MIRPFVRILIAAAGLAWAGCGVEPDPSASTATSELTAAAAASGSEITQVGALSGDAIQLAPTSCGFECHGPTSDILGVPWSFCLRLCPGGPSNCTPMPPPPCP